MSYKQSSKSISMVLMSAMAAGISAAPFPAADAANCDESRSVCESPAAAALEAWCTSRMDPLLPQCIPLPVMPLTWCSVTRQAAASGRLQTLRASACDIYSCAAWQRPRVNAEMALKSTICC